MSHRRSMYQTFIREELDKLGWTKMDPRHVEAYMRVEYGTLDHLGGEMWQRAVRNAAVAVEVAGAAEAEDLAGTYGL